jgi:hypothetical protein
MLAPHGHSEAKIFGVPVPGPQKNLAAPSNANVCSPPRTFFSDLSVQRPHGPGQNFFPKVFMSSRCLP